MNNVKTGVRFALAAAMGLWIGDTVLLAVTRAGASWSQWAKGILAAAFVSLSTALVLGALLGPVLAPVLRQLAAALGAGWTALRRGDADARRRLVGRTLAAYGLLAVWIAATYRVAMAVVFDFARPETMAAAMTAADMALALALAVAWPWAVRLGLAVADRASRTRGLRAWVTRAWPLPAVGVVAGLTTLVVIAVVQRSALRSLPWRDAVPVAGLALGVVFAIRWPRSPLRVRRGASGFAAAVFAAGLLAALLLRPESATAQGIAFDRALSGRTGYAAWTFVADLDRDGQIGLLGGGDCAPFDPERYTGAADAPGDGIDQDCDGVDATAQALKPRPPMVIGAGAVPARPTVLLVTVDALGAPELSALGSPRPVMPRVDELAARSMLFERCFAQGPSTRTSFPSIFTSRWDSEQTFEYSPRPPYSFDEGEMTLQDAFNQAGYDTVAVIPDGYFDRTRWSSITKGFRRVDTSALTARSGKHDAAEVTDAALRILAERRDRPLFMWVHYFDAHPPYGLPPGAAFEGSDDRTFYEQELAYVDTQLGRVIDAVDRRAAPVYLVLTADHATSFHPEPDARQFHYGYDVYTSTLHVPLIFHGPGLRTGRVAHVVSTMDVTPTLANLVRLSDGGRFEGTSLAPELLRGEQDASRVTFHELYVPENEFRGRGDPLELLSLRTDQYNLVLNRKRGTYELYAWPSDYYEQHDLYEERGRSAEVMHLRSLLGSFIRAHDRAPAAAAPRSWIARRTLVPVHP